MPVGRSKALFDKFDEAFEPKNIQEFILKKYKQGTIDALTDSLQKVDRVSTGELSQSVDVRVFEDGGVVSFQIIMEDYWKFVDKGVDGRLKKVGSPYSFKKKNISQIAAKDFVTARGITTWKDKSGKITLDVNAPPKRLKVGQSKSITRSNKFKSLYFLAGRAIANYGVRPTHFYTDVINEDWIEGVKKDIAETIVKGFK